MNSSGASLGPAINHESTKDENTKRKGVKRVIEKKG
jgi:hypothetical protein